MGRNTATFVALNIYLTQCVNFVCSSSSRIALSAHKLSSIPPMVRSMTRGEKLVVRKKMKQLMVMLGLKETLDRMAKANAVRWYGHVIKRDDDNILKAMMMQVNGKRKRGRPKMTWRRQVEESVKKVGLKIEEAADLQIEGDGGKV